MKKALLLLAFTPTMALAQERTFNCEVPNGNLPEMAVTLVSIDNGHDGYLMMGGEKKTASVYPGLDSVTYLMFSDDYSYTLHYNLNLKDGHYDFSRRAPSRAGGAGPARKSPANPFLELTNARESPGRFAFDACHLCLCSADHIRPRAAQHVFDVGQLRGG